MNLERRNLQPKSFWGMMEAWWNGFGAVCWQPTGPICVLGRVWGCRLATYGSPRGLLERIWGCRLASYRSYGACWNGFGAACWQPTGLMVSLGLCVGKLRV